VLEISSTMAFGYRRFEEGPLASDMEGLIKGIDVQAEVMKNIWTAR